MSKKSNNTRRTNGYKFKHRTIIFGPEHFGKESNDEKKKKRKRRKHH